MLRKTPLLFFPGLFYLLMTIAFFQCSTSNQKQAKTDASAAGAKIGHWDSVSPKDNSEPIPRHEAAFVGVGNKFYLLGGRGDKPSSIYDSKSGTWTQASAPPVEMHHFQPVVYQDKVYILGAMTGPYPTEVPIPNIYIYHPKEDRWEKGPEIPESRRRGGAGATLYKGKIFLSCGIKDGHRGDHKKWLDVFDPVTGSWEELPDAPRPRDHFQSLAVNDKLYVLGGRTTKSDDNPFKHTIGEVDVYDMNSRTWSTITDPLPTLRAGNYVILAGEEILVMGGESFFQEPAHSEVEALNINTHTWTTMAPMLEGRHGTGIIPFKGKFYIASGSGNRGGGPELKTMECFSLK